MAVHVHSEVTPDVGFEPIEPDLEDAYFWAIKSDATPARRRRGLIRRAAMLLTVAGFEFGQRLKRLSTWIYFTLFLAIGVLFFLAAAGTFQNITGSFGAGGKVMANSPYTLAA